MDNVEVLKQVYKDLADSNVEAVLSSFQPDIVWDECSGFPYVKNDGVFKGRKEIVDNVLSILPEYIDGFNIEIDELFGAGDKVVMKGYYEGTWKPTGNRFKANATHVWTVKNGKANHFFQAVDTAEITHV